MVSKGTKARGVRGVPDDKWQRFQEWAAERGTNASDVLRRYIDECLTRKHDDK